MSHHHCHEGECHHHHHGEHHHCCCSHHHECCEHHHEEQEFSKQLLEMADEAWMDVLYDKIKEHVLKSHGAHLDQLAKLVSDTNGARWKEKMAMQKNCHDFKAKLEEFFNK